MSLIKSPAEQQILKVGGKKLHQVLEQVTAFAKPGVSLLELDSQIEHWMIELGGTPSFKGYDGFPNASCLSLNDEVVHGIPNQRTLASGDILGVDVGLWYEGLCTDAAITLPIGQVSQAAKQLLAVTELALNEAIKQIKPGRRVGVISYTIECLGNLNHLGIVRTLTGHGVGHKVHEDPSIPNVGKPGDGMLLRPGMVLAIEPMFTLGHGAVLTDVDGWTIRTKDGSLSAQFEHTVIVTEYGVKQIT